MGEEPLDLEGIRARNEEEKAGIAAWPHRYCEDTWYACPMHPEYAGLEAPLPENCNCDLDERQQRIADIDALLAECKRLNRELDEFAIERLRRLGLR